MPDALMIRLSRGDGRPVAPGEYVQACQLLSGLLQDDPVPTRGDEQLEFSNAATGERVYYRVRWRLVGTENEGVPA